MSEKKKNKWNFFIEILGPGGLAWNKRGKTVIGNGMGSGPDQLYLPNGIFIEPKTHILYIADMSNSRIQKRYPNGDIKTAAGQANGTSGKAPNMLSGPADIFADENENIFIADWGNQRIQFWQKDANSGKTVAGNGSCGPALNEFNFPSTVFFDSKKNIIVSDYKNQRVTQWPFSFDPKTSIGTIIAGGNGAGLNPYQLNGPTGLYYDEKNQILYISNEQSHSITQWVLGDYEPRNIYAGIPGRPGNSAAQLFFPEGLTLDKYGNLYVADTSNHRIQMVCPDAILGITIAGTGQLGNSSSELSYPADIAFDSDLNLYVSDRYNNRIQNDFSPDVNDYNAYGLKIAANNLIIVEAQNDLDWFNIQLAPYTDDVTKNDERGCFFGYNDSSWYVYTIALGKNQSTYSFFFVGEMIGLDEDEKLPNRTFVGFINYNGSLDAIDCDDFILVKTYVTGAFTHQEQLVMTTDPLGSVAYGFSDLFTFSYTASTNNLTVQQNNSPSPSTPFLPYAVDYDGSHGIIAGFLKNDQNSRIKYNTTVILFTIDVSTAAVTPIISWRYPMNGTTWQAGQTNAGADKNDPKFDILITTPSDLVLLAAQGGLFVILSASSGNYSSTIGPTVEAVPAFSSQLPCMPGTYKNVTGIRRCLLCPTGTKNDGINLTITTCVNCATNTFCPLGSVSDSISNDQLSNTIQSVGYPKSPDITGLDDILFFTLFSIGPSARCVALSPIFWTLIVAAIITLIISVMLMIKYCIKNPKAVYSYKLFEKIFKQTDIIREGEMWVGGLATFCVIVLCVSCCVFSAKYYKSYPIETAGPSTYTCDT
ncbi:unnamed protein product, partial [Rotaria sordida]